MPPLYFAPPARPDPSAGASSDAAMNFIRTLIEGAAKSRKRKYEDTLIGQIMGGASQEELQTAVTAGQDTERPGFLGRIKEMFSPDAPYRGGVSDSPIAQLVMSGKLRVKAITDPQITGVEKLIQRGIKGAEGKGWHGGGRFFGHNFEEKEVKNAWDQAKRLTRFKGRTDADKQFIFDSFKDQISQWGGADEVGWWEDSWFEKDLPGRPQTVGQQGGEIFVNPQTGEEIIWDGSKWAPVR